MQEEKDIEQINSICKWYGMTLEEFNEELKRITMAAQKMLETRKVPDQTGT